MVYVDMVYGDMTTWFMSTMVLETCFKEPWFMVNLVFCVHQVNGGIAKQLNIEVLHYDYHASFFDIYVSLLSYVS